MIRKIAAVLGIVAAVAVGGFVTAPEAEAASVQCRYISGFWPWSGYWMCYRIP